MKFFTEVFLISAGNLAFTCFCKIANINSIFSLLFGFLWVSILLHFGLKRVKIHKIKATFFFYSSSTCLQYKIMHYMQLRLTFHKMKEQTECLKISKSQSWMVEVVGLFVLTIIFVCTYKFPIWIEVLLLPAPSLLSNFNLRKGKQTLIVLDL